MEPVHPQGCMSVRLLDAIPRVNDDDDGCDDEVGAGCYRDHQGRQAGRHLDEEDRRQERRLRRHQDEGHLRHQGERSHQGDRQGGLPVRVHDHQDRVAVGLAYQTHSLVGLVVVELACQTRNAARLKDLDDAARRPCPLALAWTQRSVV